MTQEIQRFADAAMFQAAPMEKAEGEEFLEPKVHLLWMTPDPLGAIAAACRMYEGKPTYNLSNITEDEQQHYFAQAQKTHLTAPLEFVKFHFFIEGVSRSFTHQMVRQRTAVYAQESLRFAVKDNLAAEAVIPISVREDPNALEEFVLALEVAQANYEALIARGIPAEDARELLPHAVSTRLNFCTDLRNLTEHAGNRLCTQAQYHWRMIFNLIVQSIREFKDDSSVHRTDRWQFDALADSPLFRPVCYQRGHCPFQASFDRGCSIRERVDANAAIGRPSSEWHKLIVTGPADEGVAGINPAEWLLDPTAGITHSEADRPS